MAKYGLDENSAFEVCPNLRAGAGILSECYDRALPKHGGQEQPALRSALSCYFSGNFSTGYKSGYVRSVVQQSALPVPPIIYTNQAPTGLIKQINNN